jgi:hypothetical protein
MMPAPIDLAQEPTEAAMLRRYGAIGKLGAR